MGRLLLCATATCTCTLLTLMRCQCCFHSGFKFHVEGVKRTDASSSLESRLLSNRDPNVFFFVVRMRYGQFVLIRAYWQQQMLCSVLKLLNRSDMKTFRKFLSVSQEFFSTNTNQGTQLKMSFTSPTNPHQLLPFKLSKP